MYLRYVTTMLQPEQYPRLYRSDFGTRERYIGNYLGRTLISAKFPTDGFNAIIIVGCVKPSDRCSLVEVKALQAPVYFDQARYDSLGPDEHHEFFLGMYIEGIEKANRDFPIPYDVLMQSIKDFRQGGYKNEWVHQRKLLRPLGLHATLLCAMDMHRFELTLLLERKGLTIFRQAILITKPHEFIFKGEFKEVVADGKNIVVKGTYDKVTFTLDTSTLE